MSKRAKLETLNDTQHFQLVEWLTSGTPYHKVQSLVKSEFGFHVSTSAFTPFWERHCVPQLLARRRQAATTADEIKSEAQKRPGAFDDATIDQLSQKAFELSISPNANPKDVKALFM